MENHDVTDVINVSHFVILKITSYLSTFLSRNTQEYTQKHLQDN